MLIMLKKKEKKGKMKIVASIITMIEGRKDM